MSPRASKVLTWTFLAAGTFCAITAGMLALRAFNILGHDDRPVGPPPITAEVAQSRLMGWAGSDVAKSEFERLKGKFISFRISAADGQPAATEDKRSVLSEAAVATLGHHIPTLRQEIGDCVSMGAANACMYLIVVENASGRPHEFKDVFPPYIYGTSRVQVGKGRIGCRSDGSIGAWAAVAVQEWGVLASDVEGVPSYSGSIAKNWGCKGPPANLIEIAKKQLVKSAAKVSTVAEARDALVNGYPITVASNVGFKMSGYQKAGKLWLTPSGSWAHQMCCIGYDNKPEPCFLILNSWGPDAHGEQPDGPQGSFWITAKTMQRILDADDSYAFSQFEGFPAQQWDLDILKQREARRHEFEPGHAHDRPVRRVESEFALAL